MNPTKARSLDKRQSPEYLQRRVAVLEARLAQLEAQATKSRTRRSPLLVSYGLIPLLACVGWAMAQQEMVPDPDANDLIRDFGGITQVTAPFEVVDENGKVVLSVRNEDNSDAIIGVFDQSGEKPLATLGMNENGAGILRLFGKSGRVGVEAVAGTQSDGGLIRALNAQGQTAAGVGVDFRGKGLIAVVDAGGTGQLSVSDSGAPALVILDRSNKQLAAVEAFNGKGRVAVLEQGRAAAELTAAEAGGGRLVVHNGGGERIAEVAPGSSGKGTVSVFDKGQEVAALEAGASGGGELSLANPQGTWGVEAYGSDPGSGGGSVIVLNKSGEEVAGLGTAPDGKGWIAIAENDQQVAAIKADSNGAGSIVLTSAEGQKGIEATGQDEDGSGGSVKVFGGADDPAVFLGVIEESGGLVAVFGKDDGSAGLSSDKFSLLDGKDPIVSIESDPGQLTVFDAEGEAVKVGLDDQGAGEVIISSQGKQVVSLEATPAGEGEVDVYGTNGTKPAAAMRSTGGTGLVAVTNSSGETASEMSVVGGLGRFVVWNPGGQVPAVLMARSTTTPGGLVSVSNDQVPVADLTAGPGGAGRLQLFDSSGRTTVEAGTLDNGNGMVRTGPNFKCAPGGYVMALAMMDCIVGRQ